MLWERVCNDFGGAMESDGITDNFRTGEVWSGYLGWKARGVLVIYPLILFSSLSY
jgi:hypothetical protein